MTVDAAALDELTDLADLLAQRIALDARIGAIIGRPSPCRAHGGVDRLEGLRHPTRRLCRPKAIDGRFRSGPLAGKTVNIKIYGKREGLLEFRSHAGLLPCAMRAESNDPDIQGRHSTVTRH